MLKLVVYSANTGILPDNPSIPDDYRWSMTDSPGTLTELGTTTATLTSEGILHISDTDTAVSDPTAGGHRRIYARYDTLDSMNNAVFEINCQVVSSGGSYGVAFGFIDTDKFLEIGLRPGSIFLIAKEGARSFSFTTEDKFHTYRIIKTGAEKMELYADGTLVFDIPYEELFDSTTGFPRQAFTTSRSDPAQWDIAYVSYSISS
jgi:hypothetical protein